MELGRLKHFVQIIFDFLVEIQRIGRNRYLVD